MKRIKNFNIFESKEQLKSIVSDIKYDLEDILLELEDGFSFRIFINDFSKSYKSWNDDSVVNWLFLEITKVGDWTLVDIEDIIIRVVEFLSLKGIYPLFDPKPQSGLETILISNKADIFKNRIYKAPGTRNSFVYDMSFKSDDIV